jgi:AmiR/NasT family two-component response regulator
VGARASTELGDGATGSSAGSLAALEPAAAVRELKRLRLENSRLEHALESRVVIEQAKGVLRERYSLSLELAFELLRHAARSNRMNIHELAAKVTASHETPPEFGRVPAPSELRAR